MLMGAIYNLYVIQLRSRGKLAYGGMVGEACIYCPINVIHVTSSLKCWIWCDLIQLLVYKDCYYDFDLVHSLDRSYFVGQKSYH